MVSHIDAAKEQNLSVKEIHEKAIALNQIYFLDVFKSAQDGLWHGGVWKKENCTCCRKDECKECVQCILVLQKGFSTPQYAACNLNQIMDSTKLSPETEKKIGITNSDLALLKKLEVRSTHRENAPAFQMSQRGRTLY